MSVEINVFNPKKFYIAGDTLEGEVVLRQSKEYFITLMTVSISALQKLKHVKTSSEYRYASSRSIEVMPKKTNVVFKEIIVLIGDENPDSPPRAVQPGELVFPFKLVIPLNKDTGGLATFEAKISEEYKFKATCSLDVFVGRKGLFTKNLNESCPLKICPLMGGDLPSLFVGVIRACDSSLSRWCCCSNGSVKLALADTPEVFFADSLQKMNLKLTNESDAVPKKIKIYLTYEFVLNPISMKFPQDKKTKIFEGDWNAVPLDTNSTVMSLSANIVCNIQNPQLPCMTYSDCEFGRMKAWILVQMSFSGSYSAEFRFPVVLATLPPGYAYSEKQQAINNTIVSSRTNGKGYFAT